MSTNNNDSGGLVVIVLAIAVWGLNAGWFYQTGQQWFDTCWQSINSKNPPATSAESTAWEQCGPRIQKALYDAGYVFGGNPEYAVTPELKAVDAACPNSFTEIPMSGV
ncbi:hypothetical protein [Paraburkholderia sp. RL17-373-BIF-A]|jgi:hypothetical protein|uniref:hypothetical protein n=1 Tax=Paraburkholderia sp. RL17-373-BIF-A TaxID=3031629 RepID=UPI0038BE06B9